MRSKSAIDRKAVAKAVCGLVLWIAVRPALADDKYGAPPPDLRLHLDRLVRSYPDWIARADDDNVVLKNGTRLPISDHRTDKSFDELIEHPDIDDMFYVPYPAGSAAKPPPKNVDPGRVRFEPLFVGMYGDCRKNEVAPKLRTIEWLPAHSGGRVAITTVNGVDQALAAVSRALDQLPSEFKRFLISDGRHLQLPRGRGLKRKIDACVWRRHRSQCHLRGLLALVERHERPDLEEPHTDRHRAYIRTARLHLGWLLVSL